MRPKFKQMSKLFRIDIHKKTESSQKKSLFQIDYLTELPIFTDALIWQKTTPNTLELEDKKIKNEKTSLELSKLPNFVLSSRTNNTYLFKATVTKKSRTYTRHLVCSNIGLVRNICQRNDGFLIQSYGCDNYKSYNIGIKCETIHSIANDVFANLTDLWVFSYNGVVDDDRKGLKNIFVLFFGELEKCALYFTEQEKKNMTNASSGIAIINREEFDMTRRSIEQEVIGLKMKELFIKDPKKIDDFSFVFDTEDLLKIEKHKNGILVIYSNRLVYYSIEADEQPHLVQKSQHMITDKKNIVCWTMVNSQSIDLVLTLSNNTLLSFKISEDSINIINQKEFPKNKSIFALDANDNSLFISFFEHKFISEFDFSFDLKREIKLAFSNICEVKFIPRFGKTLNFIKLRK